jgi:PAS domain S-box-containing protein
MDQGVEIVKNLKNYSLFLIENHFEELISEAKRIAERSDLFSNYYHSQNDNQIMDHYELEWKIFLYDIINNIEINLSEENLNKFSFHDQEYNPQLSELFLLLSVRKQALIHFLSRYTEDVKEYQRLIFELEEFFNRSQNTLIRTIEINLKKSTLSETPINSKEMGLNNFSIFENLPAMIWKSGSDAKINYLNNAWINFRGRSWEEESGDGWTEGIHPDDRSATLSSYISAFNDRKPFQIEYRLLRNDGDYRWVVHIGTPYKDDHGNFGGYLGVCYDVTERKISEQLSNEKTQILENILFNIPLVMIQLNEHGLIQEMIGKGLKKLNIKDNQYNGVSIFELYPESKFNIERALHGKSSSFILEIENEGTTSFFQTNFFFNNVQGRGAIGLMFDMTDQKLIERELQEKNQLLDGIMFNIPGILTRINEHGEIFESLGAGLGKLGKIPNEFNGLNVFDAYPENSEFIHKALHGEKVNFYSKIKINDKEFYYNTYLFHDSIKGKGAVAYSLDITEQKMAEETARELNESLMHAVEGIAMVDKDGKYISINKAKSEILGYCSEELIGMNWKHTIHHDDWWIADQAYDKMKYEGKSSFEARGVRKDGSTFYKDVTLISNVDKDGAFKGHHSFIKDISRRKESEEKLKRNEALLTESQRVANVGSWEWDVVKNEIVWSSQMYAIYELEGERKFTFESFLENVFYEDIDAVKNEFMQCLNSGNSFSVEHRVLTNSGKEKILLCKGKVAKFEEGKSLRILGSELDITELKAAENTLQKTYQDLKSIQEDLKQVNSELEDRVQQRTEELYNINKELKISNDQLIKINSDLDNFIYTASHDLKTPISNIEGLIYALRDEIIYNENGTEKSILDMMEVSINRFKSTILDLTEITKIQKNIFDELEEVSLKELLKEVSLDMDEEINFTNTIINTNFEISFIQFSRKNLRSVLYNLINNAIKYRDPNRTPEIFISTFFSEARELVLTVSDNGLGIEEGQIGKIFTMFKRLHDHVSGSGIGLYIVKRIIENIGGRIEVTSTLGTGTEFKIYIPMQTNNKEFSFSLNE